MNEHKGNNMNNVKYALIVIILQSSLAFSAKTPIVGAPSSGIGNNMTYPGQNLPTNNAFQGPASNPYNQQNNGPISPAQRLNILVNPLNNTYTCQAAGVFSGPDGRKYQCPKPGTYTIPHK
jgi:hypothetical protein